MALGHTASQTPVEDFYEFISAELTTAGKQNLNGLRRCSGEWQLISYIAFRRGDDVNSKRHQVSDRASATSVLEFSWERIQPRNSNTSESLFRKSQRWKKHITEVIEGPLGLRRKKGKENVPGERRGWGKAWVKERERENALGPSS